MRRCNSRIKDSEYVGGAGDRACLMLAHGYRACSTMLGMRKILMFLAFAGDAEDVGHAGDAGKGGLPNKFLHQGIRGVRPLLGQADLAAGQKYVPKMEPCKSKPGLKSVLFF